MRTKTLTPNDLQINKARREILCVASSNDPDRDLEVVQPEGLRMSGVNYAGRPVLWGHNKTIPAIGSILWLKADGDNVLAKYRITDKTDFARDIFELIQDDCLRFHSIGFEVFGERPPTPLEIKERPDWAGVRNIVTDFEVLELSVCNVPCNPEASVIVKSYSSETQRLLGEQWQPVDCWQYETKSVETKPTLPTPRYTRVYNQDQHIKELLAKHDAENVIARIKGLA